MTGPLISIVIPAKNAQATIKKCIDSIVQQTYKNYELIVINDGSIDKTAQILTDYPQAMVLTTPGTGPSKARNIGIAQAKGEFVAFTDADCVVEENWLKELLKAFVDEKIAGVGGVQRGPEDDSNFGKKVQRFLEISAFVSDYMKSGWAMRQVKHNPACNVMYRKSVLIEMGGFMDGLWPGEDVELDYRIKRKGYKIIFNPQAIVYHYRTPNMKSFLEHVYRYGWSAGFLAKRYGIFRIIQALPVFTFISSLLLLFLMFWNWAVAIILIILFLLALLIAYTFDLCLLFLSIGGFIFWHLGYAKGLIKTDV